MTKFLSKKTYQLSNKEIKAICLLKDTHWNFGLKLQLVWFKQNVKSFDIHNILTLNKKLIGYTLLRKRKMNINSIRYYLLFDTLIIKKNFRNKRLSKLLMEFNNQIIKKNKKISFLMCSEKLIKFYKKNNWLKLNKRNFKVMDHKFNTNGMIFNSKRKYLNIDFYTK